MSYLFNDKRKQNTIRDTNITPTTTRKTMTQIEFKLSLDIIKWMLFLIRKKNINSSLFQRRSQSTPNIKSNLQ